MHPRFGGYIKINNDGKINLNLKLSALGGDKATGRRWAESQATAGGCGELLEAAPRTPAARGAGRAPRLLLLCAGAS